MPRLRHDPRPSFLDSKIERNGLEGLFDALDYALDAPSLEAGAALTSWALSARPSQRPSRGDWDVWVMMAGRGFGKTRAGAEWVLERIGDPRHRGPKSHMRIALVAATLHEARSVMVEGESGILALYATRPSDAPKWEPSLRQLTWPNGARAFVYGAAEPDALRGPQHHFAWCDEIAKWQQGGLAWMNLQLGLRLGGKPRVLATTTPRHCALVTQLVRDADAKQNIYVSTGRMDDNKSHLPPSVRAMLTREYGGTWLGRQELDGELVDGVEDAMWTHAALEAARARHDPALPLRRVVIGVDPAITEGGDACGIVVAALLDPAPINPVTLNPAPLGSQGIYGPVAGGKAYGGRDFYGKGLPRAVVLADESVSHMPPEGWAARVADAAARFGADLVVAESNQGGQMVESVLLAAASSLPLRLVNARRGKAARAEPVSIWYANGRIAHADIFPALDEQLCGLSVTRGYTGPGASPDRADALVYALSALLGEGAVGDGPRVLGWA